MENEEDLHGICRFSLKSDTQYIVGMVDMHSA